MSLGSLTKREEADIGVALGKIKGFKIGMKLVRGAYMEKERERAEKLKYKSPICENKEATDKNYNVKAV